MYEVDDGNPEGILESYGEGGRYMHRKLVVQWCTLAMLQCSQSDIAELWYRDHSLSWKSPDNGYPRSP
jgi:hypothetical protein